MGISEFFQFKGSMGVDTEIPEIFSMKFSADTFIKIDVETIYKKILTDVLERTHGLSEDQTALLFDNCVMSSKNQGLISTLAKAMSEKKELYLVYQREIKIVREAKAEEVTQIKLDYETKAESSVGIYLSFKENTIVEMLRFYSGMEYNTVASLYKSQGLSKAIQIKMNDLRASVSATNSVVAIEQAKKIAESLGKGKDVLIDAKDSIETSRIDLTSTKESIAFIDSKRAFYLGMPLSYITGALTGGIGSTGESDTKAVERGLKAYYFSVIKPVLTALFGGSLTYKSQDFRHIELAIKVMQAFDLASEDYVSYENKKKIIESILELDSKNNKTTETPPLPPPAPDVKP